MMSLLFLIGKLVYEYSVCVCVSVFVCVLERGSERESQ